MEGSFVGASRVFIRSQLTMGMIATVSAIFFFLFLLGCSCNAAEICKASSCGNIHNISFPFRLKGDPNNCGLPDYELSCESNRTLVLYLSSMKFYVDAISYEVRTIRVVDSGLERDNCSSLPHNSLGKYDFSGPFHIDSVITDIIYVNCSASMDDGSYMTTTSCFNSSSLPYFYAIIGLTSIAQVNSSCTVIRKTFIEGNVHSAPAYASRYFTYTQIHSALLMGFDLYWYLPPPTYQCEERPFGSTHCIVKTILQHILDLFVNCLPVIERIMIARTSIGIFCLAVLLIYKLWREHLSKDEKVKKLISKYKSHIPVNYSYSDVKKMTIHFKENFEDTMKEFLTEHLSRDANIEEFLNKYKNHVPMRYSYSHIKKMTGGFKEKLGQGGFGCVYKGQLQNGHLVAVKMLSKSKGSGQDFINEVSTIGRIHHNNVVQLLGFCSKGSKRALIYDFMPNGSLDKYIFSQEGEGNPLSWEKLYGIALGIAQGIEYLHRGCDIQILHFDIKPHNILLDQNFTPKVSDFGLAKFYPTEESSVSLTAARGTIGYIAPELFYRNVGRVSYKSDVYSFGMLLLEIAGRRRNIDANAENLSQIYFPSWLYDQLIQGKDIGMGEATKDEKETGKKLVIVALWCIQMKPIDRPSMSKVVEMLEGEAELLQMPPKPFLSPQKVTEDAHAATTNGT